MRKQKGITLIALVITVIVLLILAAVSITALTDEDKGVVTKAKQAAQKTEDAATDEDSEIQEILDYAESEDVVVAGFTVVFLLVAGGTAYVTRNNATKVNFPLTNPSKDGYEFTGWYYDSACTNKATDGDTVTKDTTLYAGWKEASSSVLDSGAITNKKNGAVISISDVEKLDGTKTFVQYTTGKDIASCSILEVNDADYIDYNPPGTREFYERTEIVLTANTYNFSKDASNSKIASFTYTQNGYTFVSAWKRAYVKIRIDFVDGTYDTDDFILMLEYSCFVEGTQIKLADGTSKNIEDITYDDELLVWDFDNGVLASSKPLWIQKKQVAGEYNLLKFENGSELKTVNQHRIFNKDAGRFTYPMTDDTPIGTTTITSDGTETKLVSKEKVQETVNYYNIITDYHMNLFAEDILTSCRLSNLYEIKDMKYVKDNRKLATKEEYPNIPEEYFKGLRIAEQPKEVNRGNDNKHDKDLEGYVQRLIKNRK